MISHTDKVFLKDKKRIFFSDKSRQKEYCGIAPIPREAATAAATQLQILVTINEKKSITITDIGTTNNFIM